ncbi:hypothetical protein TNCV_3849431 [Trichonephila clavipes]|uniref:Uncharacterized protein n=1 Tax=Trichonephila clavipes TaxID=2585209 RepID=A0A8X6R8G8_TRICX|nr:hypothetical protein TNCV_3849431 [Trichonephila clavipes]
MIESLVHFQADPFSSWVGHFRVLNHLSLAGVKHLYPPLLTIVLPHSCVRAIGWHVDPHYETASCPTPGGHNLSCPTFTDSASLARLADSTLQSSSICACLIFLQQVILKFLDTAHVPPSLRRSTVYQHDRTPLHYAIHARRHLWIVVDRSCCTISTFNLGKDVV